MRILRSKRWIALMAAVLVAAAASAVGVAASRAVVSKTVLNDVTNMHYSTMKFVADDYDSGWLIHPGLVVVQVQQGSLQIKTADNCTAKTVGPGETFIKTPYTPTRGVSTGRVVFTATFIVPYEQPLLMPAPSACP